MNLRKPPAEVEVDAALARRLLEDQHPDLPTGPLTLVDEGWDNFVFRLGSDLALRLPRRQVAVALLENELRWLPSIAERLPVAVPVPVAAGVPSALYRWPWGVMRWIPGTTPDDAPLDGGQAEAFAEVLRRLHRPASTDAPRNPFRGVPLAAIRDRVEERLRRLGLSQRTHDLWRRAVGTESHRKAVWVHGDLHPRNVLVRDGAVAGIIDWGDLTAGDAAIDLAAAWMHFDPPGRGCLLDAYGATDAQRRRAIGWAVHIASVLADSGEPGHVRIGRRILGGILET